MLKLETFSQVMTTLSSYYNKPLDQFILKIYYTVFSSLGDEEFTKLAERIVIEFKYFPKVDEINEIINGKKDNKSLIAWGLVVKAIGKSGYMKSVRFIDDPKIHQAIRLCGGWEKICSTQVDELPFKQKEFERAYNAVNGIEKKDDYLPGQTERINQLNGISEPISVEEYRYLNKQSPLKLLKAGEQ